MIWVLVCTVVLTKFCAVYRRTTSPYRTWNSRCCWVCRNPGTADVGRTLRSVSCPSSALSQVCHFHAHINIHNNDMIILDRSQRLQTSANAMLFARWHHHIRFGSGLPYAPFNAMLTKILKWSRIQDSFRITPKIESLVVFAIPNMPSKFQKDPSRTFWVILLTHRQTDKQTNKLRQKHNLLCGGNCYSAIKQCFD